MAIIVSVVTEQIKVKKSITVFCKKVARSVLEYLQIDDVIVTLILTDDTSIAKINKTYRKKDGPTDVISFAYREAPMPHGTTKEHLGDIFISMDTARRQSEEYNVSLEQELKRLIVHGILHLLGYDHESSAYKRRIMQKMEDTILNSIQ